MGYSFQLAASGLSDRIANTTAFVTPVIRVKDDDEDDDPCILYNSPNTFPYLPVIQQVLKRHITVLQLLKAVIQGRQRHL